MLIDKIKNDLTVAMKGKNELVLMVLRMLMSAAKNKQIELKTDKLSEEQFITVVSSEVKKRKDSIEAYKQGNRNDLAEKEQNEIDILLKYMPKQLGEEEIAKAVAETITEMGEGANFGAVMGKVMAKLKGQADGNVVRDIVNKKLQ